MSFTDDITSSKRRKRRNMQVTIDLAQEIKDAHGDTLQTVSGEAMWPMAAQIVLVVNGDAPAGAIRNYEGPKKGEFEKAVVLLAKAAAKSKPITVGNALLTAVLHVPLDDDGTPEDIGRDGRRKRTRLEGMLLRKGDRLLFDVNALMDMLVLAENRYKGGDASKQTTLTRLTDVILDAKDEADAKEKAEAEADASGEPAESVAAE